MDLQALGEAMSSFYAGYGPARTVGAGKGAGVRSAPYAASAALGGALNSKGYPLNPGSQQCAFYLKTGSCKFGATCRFDHPEDGGAAGALNSSGYPLNPGQQDCSFYTKTGNCKFGATCKFNHPEDISVTEPALSLEEALLLRSTKMNSAGYPANMGAPDCTFFMKTGTCKFGATCKFNHPEGVATQEAGDGSEARGGVGNKENRHAQAGVLSGEGYPLNPGQPDCQFYMKTGSCKFGATCRFNHPDGIAGFAMQAQPPLANPRQQYRVAEELNSRGFPLNLGAPDCDFYMRKGTCKFGATCKYNHPEGVEAQEDGGMGGGMGGGFGALPGAAPGAAVTAPAANPFAGLAMSSQRARFSSQLTQLAAMGFTNEADCLRALAQHDGRVDAAIDTLLSGGGFGAADGGGS
mmetsp:Transcript_68499/g.191973  ORF Transcript_68499/g.191973 Transcript_68499/m.191973 type:complete len:408 (+) Transcript_68499:125-1348(+)